MSGGMKLLFGCLGLSAVALILGGIALVVLFQVGGSILEDRVGNLAGGIGRQAEAQRTLERLQEEHAFEQPDGGIVDDSDARMVFAVTDDMWAVMRPWADELSELALRVEQRDAASITDLAAGFRGLSRFAEGRAVFAETLDAHGVSAEEYIWTGLAMIRAHEELERPAESRVAPEANMALARRYDEELTLLRETGEGSRPEKGAVFHLAALWGMADGSSWRAMGLDTLSVPNR
ncbi:MAG: hypothetical protein WD960_02825 [Gemmatimonadota bacterium]